jgi:hypothetical protein
VLCKSYTCESREERFGSGRPHTMMRDAGGLRPPTDGRPSALIVTMGTDYVAPARMPRELKSAGFRVTLLAPRGAIATRTRYLDQLGFIHDQPSVYLWLQTFASAVAATKPDWVLPGDDITLHLLIRMVLDAPPELRSDIRQGLTTLVRRSLGPPERYLDSVDKARLVRVASEIGIAVPPGEAIANEREEVEAALALGFPVIVRPTVGTASEGVAVCTSADAVRAAVAALPREDGAWPQRSKCALVQRFLTGIQCNRAAVAWEGREMAGFTRIAERRYPNALGPGSVTRYRRMPAVADANRRLLEQLGVTGFASTLYIVDPATGTPHLIEINRRMTPATHTGRLVGVDLAAAFAACAVGSPYTGPTDLPDGPERVLALFPQEWLRDPYSDDLHRFPTDTPFDDPDLLRALIDLGTGRA